MVTKSDFVLEWDKALGFKGDPFADKIFAPINDFLVNRKDEKEKINWFFIKGYSHGVILGEEGVGKTTLLKWLEGRLRRYNRLHAVYINAAIFKEQINIMQKMIMPLLSFYEKIISKPHKKIYSMDSTVFLKKKLGGKSIALLIDNAHHLTEKNLEMIKSLRKEGLKIQVVVASTPKEYEKSRLAEIGQDELNITLRRLTYAESREMIIRRIVAFGGRGTHPFSEEDLQRLYDRADKNPRELIRLCKDEAIKILIHQRELLESRELESRKQKKPLKTLTVKAPEQGDDDTDIKIRKASKSEIKDEMTEERKRLIRIKFDLGKKEPPKQRKPDFSQPRDNSRDNSRDDRALNDDEHKQDLLNKMSSTSPRRQDKEQGRDNSRDNKSISETDKLLKELAEEFEVD